RIVELMEQIEMPPAQFMDRFPGELSGGQKQRVCIARALAAKPRLVICDEVTSALDQIVAEGILRLLQKLQDKFSLCYFFITHDLSIVRAIADEVAVMKDGRVLEYGARAEIFSPPHHEYTELLLSSVPDMNPDWLTDLLKQRGAAAG
ncbi:MAG: ATP-binding cassette domain-containing protein, partial [Betaproteobacteria bacterium]|nr:ATP-binding cassette domain-containing protein [Betaproteobacteria bacterium]